MALKCGCQEAGRCNLGRGESVRGGDVALFNPLLLAEAIAIGYLLCVLFRVYWP